MSLGIPVLRPEETERVDLAIDGVDEIDGSFCAVKGGGTAAPQAATGRLNRPADRPPSGGTGGRMFRPFSATGRAEEPPPLQADAEPRSADNGRPTAAP